MAVDHITARAHDNSNDGSTPGGGGEPDRLGPGIWKIIAVTVAGAFMTQLTRFRGIMAQPPPIWRLSP